MKDNGVIIEKPEFTGVFTTLTSKESVEDIFITLDKCSLDSVMEFLRTGRITKDTQSLFIIDMIIPKDSDNDICKGQSGVLKAENGFTITANPGNPVHFSAQLQCLGYMLPHRDILYAMEIKIANFDLDFSSASRSCGDDVIVYSNVRMMVYSNNNSMTILGE